MAIIWFSTEFRHLSGFTEDQAKILDAGLGTNPVSFKEAEDLAIEMFSEISLCLPVVMKTRVGVIFGGRYGEHEILIRPAKTVIATIDRINTDPEAWPPCIAGTRR